MYLHTIYNINIQKCIHILLFLRLDGFTYERAAINEWFLCGKYTSPMTNATRYLLHFKSYPEKRYPHFASRPRTAIVIAFYLLYCNTGGRSSSSSGMRNSGDMRNKRSGFFSVSIATLQKNVRCHCNNGKECKR